MTAPSDQLPPGARVLVIRLSAFGDVLFALETIAALKQARPDVRIDFLVEDRFAGLLEGHPQIERVLVYPRRRKLRILGTLLRLRRTRYDAVLDLHGILKSALHVLFARSPRKLGFTSPAAREGSHRFYRTAVPLPEPLPHRADRGPYLLRALGIDAVPLPPVLALMPPAVDPWAGAGGPRIVLHPGTSAFARFKRWPAERFGELAARLCARKLCVAVSFGPGERDLADAIRQLAPSVRLIDGSALGLRGLGAVLQQADLVIAADTGPLHFAAAAGVPVVALFGPKDPALYGPRAHGSVQHQVLFADVPCRPCKRRDCASPQCVLALEVDTVERAVLQALAVAA